MQTHSNNNKYTQQNETKNLIQNTLECSKYNSNSTRFIYAMLADSCCCFTVVNREFLCLLRSRSTHTGIPQNEIELQNIFELDYRHDS